MSISFRFWILFGVIVTSCFISVYCSATVELVVDLNTARVEHENGTTPIPLDLDDKKLVRSDVDNNGSSSNRGVFARCLSTIWDWVSSKATSGLSELVEDKIISGNPDNVKFYLYPNADNKDYVEEIIYGDTASLRRSHFRPNLPWKIVIHGFTNHHISEPVQQIKNAYLVRELQTRMASGGGHGSQVAPGSVGYNVIVVDWGQLADPKFGGDTGNLFYGFAVKNVPLVGKRVGEFVYFLLQNGGAANLDQIHLIGFSLGSHVSGNAGNTLRELTGQLVGRISGLDPAGPSFYQGLKIASRQLSPEDAKFVDIIHTNQGALGIYKNIGHVDFFPNGGGPVQKPCLVEYGHSQNENGIVMLNTCSHSKAPFFFSLSINELITGCRCDSLLQWKTTCPCTEKAVFGEYCDPRTRGTFYLDLDR